MLQNREVDMVVNVEEIWKVVDNYPKYEVSNKGRIRSQKVGWKLVRSLNTRVGYKYIDLWNEKGGKSFRVHILVLEAFVGPRPSGSVTYETNHIDGDKLNNDLRNLEWVTKSANMCHAIKSGLYTPPAYLGSKSSNSKLKEGEVWLIKKLVQKRFQYIIIAKMFKVTPNCIRHIALGWTWGHLN